MTEKKAFKNSKLLWHTMAELKIDELSKFNNIHRIKKYIFQAYGIAPTDINKDCSLCEYYFNKHGGYPKCPKCPLCPKHCHSHYSPGLTYYKAAQAIIDGEYSYFKRLARIIANAIPE